jgi:hypothetical protein
LWRIFAGTSLAIFGTFLRPRDVELDAPAKPVTTSARAAAARSSPAIRRDMNYLLFTTLNGPAFRTKKTSYEVRREKRRPVGRCKL